MPYEDQFGDPSPIFEWPLSRVDTVCRRLETAGLSFSVSLPQDGSVFDQLDAAVHSQLRTIDAIVGLPPPEFQATPPTSVSNRNHSNNLLAASWVVLGPVKKRSQHEVYIWQPLRDPLLYGTCTTANLLEKCSKLQMHQLDRVFFIGELPVLSFKCSLANAM